MLRLECWKPPDPISPMWSYFIRCRSVRTCQVCVSASPPATDNFLPPYLELRNVAAPQVPAPAQYVAIAAYGDEAHVQENRKLYSAKFDLADQIVGGRYGYERPAGGFFLWLDISKHGSSEMVTKKFVVRGRRARRAGTLPRARAKRRQQSRRGLYPGRHGSGQGSYGGGAASPRRRVELGM